jgi:hypothetical protein
MILGIPPAFAVMNLPFNLLLPRFWMMGEMGIPDPLITLALEAALGGGNVLGPPKYTNLIGMQSDGIIKNVN